MLQLVASSGSCPSSPADARHSSPSPLPVSQTLRQSLSPGRAKAARTTLRWPPRARHMNPPTPADMPPNLFPYPAVLEQYYGNLDAGVGASFGLARCGGESYNTLPIPTS